MGGPVKPMIQHRKKVESVKVKVSGYEYVYYSYGHGMQYKQHKEHVFRVGWMWTVMVEESVMVTNLLKQLMM